MTTSMNSISDYTFEEDFEDPAIMAGATTLELAKIHEEDLARLHGEVSKLRSNHSIIMRQ